MFAFFTPRMDLVRLFAALALALALVGWAHGSPSDGTLRYLAIGVSQAPNLPANNQLKFAHKDAQDLARLWKSQHNKLCKNVAGELLLDANATRANILGALDTMIRDARPGDLGLISLAGHGGCTGARGEWSFVTHDFDPANRLDTGVSATELRARLSMLAQRGATVILLIDCCHAGGFGHQHTDFVVFAACSPTEFSQEGATWQNGVFTKAFIEAVDGKADFNGDGCVTLAEIDAYVTNRVPELLGVEGPFVKASAQNPATGRPACVRGTLALGMVTHVTPSGYPLKGHRTGRTMAD